ncbi:MAG: paraquat-inducible protein A [Maricaulaceae bacterium]|nr:paraquat-inducible protein A [Maricaulaceae bacterium]
MAPSRARPVFRDPHGPGGAPGRLLLVSGIALLPLGVFLPFLETRRLFFFKDSYSLFDVSRSLLASGEWLLGGVIIGFCLVFPTVKALALIRLHFAPPARVSGAVLRWLERLGKWSMLDVMVAALIVVGFSRNGTISAASLPGLYFFAAAAVCLMLASGLIARDLSEMAAETRLTPQTR